MHSLFIFSTSSSKTCQKKQFKKYGMYACEWINFKYTRNVPVKIFLTSISAVSSVISLSSDLSGTEKKETTKAKQSDLETLPLKQAKQNKLAN